MLLPFTKMQGAGNDFVVIDMVTADVHLSAGQIRQICDRRFGVGCDQLLALAKPENPAFDFRYLIWNADGGQAQMCGNGARCVALFARNKGLTNKESIRCETVSGSVQLDVLADGRVRVDMGVPRFEPKDLAMDVEGVSRLSRASDTLYQIRTDAGDCWMSIASLGNPHAVMLVGDAKTAPVAEVGPAVQASPVFTESVNVGFLQVIDRTHVNLRVYERGAGETLACGTGSCAAVLAGIRRGMLDPQVQVRMPGGLLEVSWAGAGEPVYLIGDAQTVFEGQMELPGGENDD